MQIEVIHEDSDYPVDRCASLRFEYFGYASQGRSTELESIGFRVGTLRSKGCLEWFYARVEVMAVGSEQMSEPQVFRRQVGFRARPAAARDLRA